MSKRKSLELPKPVRTPTILQFEAAECGAAALAIILGYYNKWIPLSVLRRELGVSRDGTNILRLRDAAVSMGFRVKASRYIPGDFPLLRYPLICHWNSAHFLVLEGADEEKCFLSDPATGRRTVSRQEFFESTPTRIILEMEPRDDFQPSGNPPDLIAGIRKRLIPYITVLIALGLLAALTTIPTIGLAAVSSTLINSVLFNDQRNMLNGLAVLSIVLILLLVPTFKLQLLLTRKLGIALSRNLSLRFLTRLLALPMSFYDTRHTAELNQRLGLNQVFANNIAGPNGQALISLVSSIIYGIILVMIAWPLAICCFLLQSLQVGVLLRSRQDRNDHAIQLAQAEGQLFATTYDALRTIETIKSSGIEDQIFRRWAGNHARYTNKLQRLTATTFQINAVSRLINDILGATILLGGGYLVIDGQLSIGWLVSFRMIYDSFAQPLLSLAGSWSQLEQLVGDVGKLDDVEREEVDIYSSLVPILLPNHGTDSQISIPSIRNVGMRINIENLAFSYDSEDRKILDDITLNIEPSKRVAFVGETGCGKSTLLRVIAGLYRPTTGSVFYNGLELEQISPEALHENLAYVTQTSQLLDGTVRENVTLFDDCYSESEVINACKMASIDKDISLLPNGYLTSVSSPGFRFSGGQRQRINLARALIRNPALLLMDEATSALDAATEDDIISNINKMNCTQVIVAHRLNTIATCDWIYYFENGHIVEQGTHSDLLNLNGLYARQYAYLAQERGS
jgi:ABC-type bacteriocin/lantibiotic exporter with double-glycine peptidase domain